MDQSQLLQSIGMAQSAIQGLSSALGSSIGDKKEQQRQYEYNMEMAKWQNDVNIANWEMQNEYNLPKNQMARLKAAGLNPNLVYGSGTSTTASTVPSASKPDGVKPVDYSGIFSRMASVIPNILDQALKVAQIDKVSQETSNLSSYQRNLNLEGDMKELQMIAQRYSNAKSKEEAEIWRDYWDNKVVGMRAQNELTDSNRFNIDSMRTFRDGVQSANVRSSTARNISEVALNQYRKSLINAQIQDLLASVGLKQSQVEKVSYEINNLMNNSKYTYELSRGKKINNAIDEILLRYGVDVRHHGIAGFPDKITHLVNLYLGTYE